MKKFKLFGLLALSACLAGICGVFVGNKTFNLVASEPLNDYGITFDSSKNKLHEYTGSTSYSGSTDVKTDLGNDINFNYYEVKGLSSTWHILGANGYFYNTDPLNGMSSIELSFKTDGSTYRIFYSVDEEFIEYEDFVSSTSDSQLFTFNGNAPCFFKVENLSGANLNISYIRIKYTCSNNNPSVYLDVENEDMGSVNGGGTKFSGSEVIVTATPNDGYKFVGWFSDEELVSTLASYSFVMENVDVYLLAKFTYESYNLYITPSGTYIGTIDDVSGKYDYLSQITLSATIVMTGYVFKGWYINNELISESNPYVFTMPNKDVTIVGKFKAGSYQVTAVSNNDSMGIVYGSGIYEYGSEFYLTAYPYEGVSFVGWYYENGSLLSTDTRVKMYGPSRDTTYCAVFEYTPYSVSLSVDDESHGSVSGAGNYILGQEVTLLATAAQGYFFAGWYNNDVLVSLDSSYVFKMKKENVAFEARFVVSHKIYLYSEDSSKGVVNGPAEWGEGLDVTVHANAYSGYAIDYWCDEDLNEKSYVFDYTFSMPNHDVTLYAVFTSGYTVSLSSINNDDATILGGGNYKVGRDVTLKANFDTGIFKGWYDNNGNLLSYRNPYSFTMTATNYAYVARFLSAGEELTREEALGIKPKVFGSTATFGTYPQSAVTDQDLIDELNLLDETVIDETGWYSYNCEYYAKVTASPYGTYSFDDGSAIENGGEYWFKCEPIRWYVVSVSSSEYVLLSKVVLDHHCFNSKYWRGPDTYGYYCNDYSKSDLRSWLTHSYEGSFRGTAFKLNEDYVVPTYVDNSKSSTNTFTDIKSSNTTDYVYLLSYSEFNTSSTWSKVGTANKKCVNTEYARATGCEGNSQAYVRYWTRSYYALYFDVLGSDKFSAYCVDTAGTLTRISFQYTACGIRPCIKIKL